MTTDNITNTNNYDVIIIGAGISGINFAYRLQERTPDLSFTILEGRNALGGTWDFFRYPGIRSDSDLYTFGFPWRPWNVRKAIAEGSLILNYLRESASLHGIDKKIQYGRHVSSSNWSSNEKRWNLDVNVNGSEKPTEFKCRFLLFCTGYYDYREPLQAEIKGISDFKGPVIHPQFWPKDLDYADKNIVIVGSGATAVTLLPALAKTTRSVTMLQRSPSYVLATPAEDGLEKLIRRWSPTSWVYPLIRFKWLALPWLITSMCRVFPNAMRSLFRRAAAAQLPKGIAADPNFAPKYNPFEQRVCFCPSGDFYKALRDGKGDVVTGRIDSVTEDAIRLTDGRELRPDVIVTATGLKLCLAGGARISVDGVPYDVGGKHIWKNMMLQDLPNAVYVIGYVDAAWTLGADSTAQLTCRVLKRMQKEKKEVVVPRVGEPMVKSRYLNLTSTYVTSAAGSLPVAGDRPQWRGRTSYFRDIWEAWYGNISSGVEYS